MGAQHTIRMEVDAITVRFSAAVYRPQAAFVKFGACSLLVIGWCSAQLQGSPGHWDLHASYPQAAEIIGMGGRGAGAP